MMSRHASATARTAGWGESRQEIISDAALGGKGGREGGSEGEKKGGREIEKEGGSTKEGEKGPGGGVGREG